MAEISVQRSSGAIAVSTPAYRWRWSQDTDQVALEDTNGRLIVSYPLQPAVVTAGTPGAAGRCVGARTDGSKLHVRYEGVNGAAALALRLRFLGDYYVLDSVTYEPAGDEAIARLVYFASWQDGALLPAAVAESCIIPGGRQDPEQAIFRTGDLDDVHFSIGCFGMGTGTFHQQWALPHYLIACYDDTTGAVAACTGLGGVPDGNVTVRVDTGRFCYEINLRGDLWGHHRGPAPQRFDWPIVTAVARDWYRAGRAYMGALVAEGYARGKRAEDVPAAAFWPQYDTWGDQALRRCILDRFDEEHLRAIYADFRASGLRAKLFVIDDKWEGVYGSLEHDTDRFPHFRELLDEMRADGYEIGLWTAFPRCEDYRALGLTEDDVLVRPDGTPYIEQQRKRSWHVFDPTSPRAAAYLRDRARHLVHTYRPKLVKIDFGYEIPTPDVAGPHDRSQSGERLFLRFLELIVGAIKEADPEVAILYYCLSPLFNDYIDQCGADDLWMSRGAYDAGFAKRALLSTWCGTTGMVPYGSSGYDWRSASEIWFDSAVIGTPGVIAPLAGDEHGERATPPLIARYNGIARVTRANPNYDIECLDADLDDPAEGPRARSWLRIEDGEPVVAALRPGPDGRAVVPGLIEADCQVVVASLTAAGLGTSPRLGIVPFGSGRVRLLRDGTARGRAHLLGGGTVAVETQSQDGTLTIELAPTFRGKAVELIEVAFG